MSSESSPVKVSGLVGKVISQVITNAYNTCAIADGTPYCWGSYSLIGDEYVLTPTAVDTGGVLAGKTITDFGASSGGPCAIADGAAFCWGRGDNGQMGDDTRLTENPLPVAVLGLEGKTMTTIAGGYSNTCAVADGAAYCWGNRTGNYSNMIGDGVKQSYGYDPVTYEGLPSNYHLRPVAVDTSGALAGKTVTHVDMGSSHVCVIASETPYRWGEWESTDPGSDEYGYVETFSPVAVGGSFAAGNQTVSLDLQWQHGIQLHQDELGSVCKIMPRVVSHPGHSLWR